MEATTKNSVAHAPAYITKVIVYGSLCVAIALTCLLLAYDLLHETLPRLRFWIGCAVISYFLLAILLLRRGRITTVNWMVFLLYESLLTAVLLHWGLSSSAGVLTASFIILLTGILMAPKLILPITLLTASILLLTYVLHSVGAIRPVLYIPTEASSLLDVIAYTTILSIFALISWVSASQSRKSLSRALRAEEKLLKQRDILSIELKKESSKLRQSQLQEIQQLYRFAVIGQSTAATLHELSNHLSVLNLDISDLKRQHQHSEAIANAEEGIEYINRMVRKARAQLNSPISRNANFNVVAVIEEILKDSESKFTQKNVSINKVYPSNAKRVFVRGEALNLAQCITILLNNSYEACGLESHPNITVSLELKHKNVLISIEDNGPGISPLVRKTLFKPLESTKSTGLGVGLYIAKHLVESHFKGKLEDIPSTTGAKFQITLKQASAP